MPNTSIDDVFPVAEKLRANIENSRIVQDISITTSIGIAERIFGESSVDWYKRLDQALYKAKNKSGNLVAR